MRIPSHAPIAVFILAAAATACEKSATAPTNTKLRTYATRLELVGPSTLAPGAQARYSATAFMSDGSTIVAPKITWGSTNPSAVVIDATGLATAAVEGESTISASLDQGWVRSSKQVVVTPPGTFMLTGTVSELDANGLQGAHVEIRAPSGEIVQTTTSATGAFRVFGVAPDGELRVTREAYLPHVERLQLTDNTNIVVNLALAEPRPDVSGNYTLTVTAGECRDGNDAALAAPLRVRTYTATVVQRAATVDVTLGGATFAVFSKGVANTFRGKLVGAEVAFTLFGYDVDFYHYDYTNPVPDVAERLPDDGFLVLSGTLDVAPAGGTMLQGTLNGWIRQMKSVPAGPVVGACQGKHAVVFTK